MSPDRLDDEQQQQQQHPEKSTNGNGVNTSSANNNGGGAYGDQDDALAPSSDESPHKRVKIVEYRSEESYMDLDKTNNVV